MLVGGCSRACFAGQGCSLGIVVVVPGISGNTSGDGLGAGCVLGDRGVSRIPLQDPLVTSAGGSSRLRSSARSARRRPTPALSLTVTVNKPRNLRAVSLAASMQAWPPASLVIMEPEESKTTMVGAMVVEIEGALDVDGLGDSVVLSSVAATGKSPA